jgi:hypothetical protein
LTIGCAFLETMGDDVLALVFWVVAPVGLGNEVFGTFICQRFTLGFDR